MSSSDTEFEEQLKEAGNRLLDTTSDEVDELLQRIEQVEKYLSRVEQSPTKSMRSALSPSLRALVTDKLFRHSDVDVKVAVASCISEMTRITAPEGPYNDDRMKEVFRIIVSSFENLSDNSSRSYARRTSILETVSRVRSCVLMLDLECDTLILEMFQNFLKSIRDYHPENVFSSMETIMTLVLEESEDISMEMLSSLLASVKKDTKEYLPIAQKLGERVIENCATKLKPFLLQAEKSSGISLDDYSEVVISVCRKTSGTGHHGDACAASQPTENKDGAREEASHDKVDSAVNVSPKPVIGNGVVLGVGHHTLTDSNSLKKQEIDQTIDRSTNTSVDLDSLDIGNTKSKPDKSLKEKGKNSDSINRTDEEKESEKLRTCTDDEKESEKSSDNHKGGSKDVPTSSLEVQASEADLHLVSEKETAVQPSSPNALVSEFVQIASPSQSGIQHDENRLERVGRPKRESSTKEVTPTAAKEKVSKGTRVKPNKRTRKGVGARTSNTNKSPTTVDAPKNESSSTSDSEAKVSDKAAKEFVRSDDGQKSPLKQTDKKKRHQTGKAILENDLKKSFSKDDDKDAVIRPNSANSTKVEHNLEETPETNSKRKRTPVEKASDIKEFGENLVGSKIKVWWPKDRMFYEGVVDSFDSNKKKHKILYVDGDEEQLNLKKQKWEFVEDDTISNVGEAADQSSPDTSSETHPNKKQMITPLSTKKGERNSSSKRGGVSSSGKSKNVTKNSGRSSEDGSKIDGKSKDTRTRSVNRSDDGGGRRTKNYTPQGESKSMAVPSKAIIKSKVEENKNSKSRSVDASTPKTSPKSTQDTSKSKGKPIKTSGKSNPTSTSKSKIGSLKMESEDMQDNTADSSKVPETGKGKSPDSSKSRGSKTKTGKKRRRGSKS